MSLVVDANLLVVLALDRERGPLVERQFRAWQASGEDLHAPSLLRYEIASALTRALAVGQLTASVAREAWGQIFAVPVQLHELTDGPGVVELALQLERQSAYDAAYVALARELGAELWTLDGHLARNAAFRGLPVKLVTS